MRAMDAPEDVLFDNLLDALDRLNDKQCGAVDVQALARGSTAALRQKRQKRRLPLLPRCEPARCTE
jgi:hypothetical protein